MMTTIDSLVQRCFAFRSTAVEDHESRARNPVTDADVSALHSRAVRSPELWDLYYDVSIIQLADQLFRDGKVPGTVAAIRAHLHRIHPSTIKHDGEQIREQIHFRYWPVARYIERVRTSPTTVIVEVEWALNEGLPWDLDAEWERHRPGLEEEAFLLYKRFAELVEEMTFLPRPQVRYRVAFSLGAQRRWMEFPTALHYRDTLAQEARRVCLDDLQEQVTSPEVPRSSANPWHPTEELQEALFALLKAMREYPDKVRHHRGYVRKRVRWHLGDQFDLASTTSQKVIPREQDEGADAETPTPPEQKARRRRKLKARVDRLGGSLDERVDLPEGAEEAEIFRHHRLAAPDAQSSMEGLGTTSDRPAQEEALIWREILDRLSSRARRIVELRIQGQTKEKIAQDIGLSPRTVARERDRLKGQLRDRHRSDRA